MVVVTRSRKKAPKERHYINNKDLYAALQAFHASEKERQEKGLPPAQIPNYIGHCIKQICERLATKGNFARYTWREEMVAHALVDCMTGVHNFDFNNAKKNAFGYFGKIAWWAFLQVIANEKRYNALKHLNLEAMRTGLNGTSHGDELDAELSSLEIIGASSPSSSGQEAHYAVIAEFEQQLTRKKQKAKVKKSKGVDNFVS